MGRESECPQVPAQRLRQSASASARFSVDLLGGFSLRLDGREVMLPEQCQRLVAYLGLNGGPVGRHQLAGALWPDCSEQRALANLRGVRWRLPAGSGCLVVAGTDRVGLVAGTAVDVDEVDRIGWALVAGDDLPLLPANHNLFSDELLPGWYEDWVIFERERRVQVHRRFAEALVRRLVRQERLAAALDVALRLVAADPLQESGQRALLTVYCAEGELALAHRQLQAYRAELHSVFGTAATVLSIEGLLSDLDPRLCPGPGPGPTA